MKSTRSRMDGNHGGGMMDQGMGNLMVRFHTR